MHSAAASYQVVPPQPSIPGKHEYLLRKIRRIHIQCLFYERAHDSRSGISGKEVFICLNNFVSVATPQLFDTLRGSRVEVLDVAISTEESATVTYRIVIQGAPVTDIERFAKYRGEWYVRVAENPRDTAAKFRKAFGL